MESIHSYITDIFKYSRIKNEDFLELLQFLAKDGIVRDCPFIDEGYYGGFANKTLIQKWEKEENRIAFLITFYGMHGPTDNKVILVRKKYDSSFRRLYEAFISDDMPRFIEDLQDIEE